MQVELKVIPAFVGEGIYTAYRLLLDLDVYAWPWQLRCCRQCVWHCGMVETCCGALPTTDGSHETKSVHVQRRQHGPPRKLHSMATIAATSQSGMHWHDLDGPHFTSDVEASDSFDKVKAHIQDHCHGKI